MQTGIKQNGISDLLIAKGAEKSTSPRPSPAGEGEGGTAGMLKRLAAEYMQRATEHDLAVRAWAEGLTARVWRPRVRWRRSSLRARSRM
jgi:hypothetical protein